MDSGTQPAPTAPSEGGGTYTISEASEEAEATSPEQKPLERQSSQKSEALVEKNEIPKSTGSTPSPQGRRSPIVNRVSGTSSPHNQLGRFSPPQRKFGAFHGSSSPPNKIGSPQGGRSPSVSSLRNTPEGRESVGIGDRETTPPSYYPDHVSTLAFISNIK